MQDITNVGVSNPKAAMTAKELAAQIKYRGCVATLTRFQAKARVKEQIKARGEKVHHFTAKQIAERADEYLNDPKHREELVAKAREWAQDFLTKRR